jgi:hypothetical protein
MTRQEKCPNTSTFKYHNANPRNRITTDCVIRAISTATDTPYNQVVMELAELQCKTGYDDGDPKLYDLYLKQNGFTKQKQPRKADNTKFTGKEFCNALQSDYGYVIGKDIRIVAHIGGHHIVAIVDGKVHDIWDATYKTIGNYWVKEN